MTTMPAWIGGICCVIVLSLSAAAGGGITVKVESGRESYLVGEPATLDLVVRNMTAKDLVAHEVFTSDLVDLGVCPSIAFGP